MRSNGALRRSTTDKMMSGLCGGIGEQHNIDPSWVRIAWVTLFLTTGFGLLVYIIASVIVPKTNVSLQY